jgi:hypothetical protein
MRILQEAGLPTDPGKQHAPLSKQEILRRTLNFLEKSDLCEFISKEWYAAKILNIIYKLLDSIDYSSNLEIMLILAAELGGFIRESEIRFGPVASQARKAGAQEKGIPEVAKLVSSLLRKNSKATSTAIWKMIPEGDFEALKVGTLKIYTSAGRLRTMKMVAREWQKGPSLSYVSFRKYVTDARKALTR